MKKGFNTYLPDVGIERNSRIPFHTQIENYLIAEIRAGRLDEETRLAGYRRIAEKNGVSLKTIRNAIDMLTNMGWLYTVPKTGAFIRYKRGWNHEIRKNREISLTSPEVGYNLEGHRLNTFPARKFAVGDTVEPMALEILKGMVLDFVKKKVGTGFEHVVMLQGQEHILVPVLKWLFTGKRVLVTVPCNPIIHYILDYLQAEAVPIWWEWGGLTAERLRGLLSGDRPVDGMVLDTYHYRMVAGSLDKKEGRAVSRLMKEYGVTVVEHHSNTELDFSRKRHYSLLPPHGETNLIYTGSLSELIEPLDTFGLVFGNKGFIVDFSTHLEREVVSPPNTLLSAAIRYLGGRTFVGQRAELKKRYGQLRSAVEGLLRERLGAYMRFKMPSSGMGCWLSPLNGRDVGKVYHAMREAGVLLGHPSRFDSNGNWPDALFFGFGQLEMEEVEKVVERMAVVLKEMEG